MSSADDEILMVFPRFTFCSCAQKMDMGEGEGNEVKIALSTQASRVIAWTFYTLTRNGSIAAMRGVAVN